MHDMAKKQIAVRLTYEALDRVKELIEHYQETSVSRVTQTDIIELAINELYKNVKGK
jgi:predicted DNA-binding protein